LHFQIVDNPSAARRDPKGWEFSLPVQITAEGKREFNLKLTAKFDDNGRVVTHIHNLSFKRPETNPVDGTSLGPYEVGEVLQVGAAFGVFGKESKNDLPLVSVHAETIR